MQAYFSWILAYGVIQLIKASVFSMGLLSGIWGKWMYLCVIITIASILNSFKYSRGKQDVYLDYFSFCYHNRDLSPLYDAFRLLSCFCTLNLEELLKSLKGVTFPYSIQLLLKKTLVFALYTVCTLFYCPNNIKSFPKKTQVHPKFCIHFN